MKKKAIRLNCDTKTAYYVDIDLSTYEIMEESIRQELNTKKQFYIIYLMEKSFLLTMNTLLLK